MATWTVGGGNMGGATTVNPDFDWGAAYAAATGGDDDTPTTTGITYEQQKKLDEANAQASLDQQKQAQEYDTAVRRRDTLDAVKAAFSQYGLDSLYGKIEEYVKKDYSADMIAILLRETPEYKARFPAMAELAKKGRAISESQYIDYERTAASLEQRYGFPAGMIMGSVTDLLMNEVSAAELNDRVLLASASSLEAPEDLRQTLKDYYGVDQAGLAAYYLDPDKALPLLEKQFATVQIGTEGRRQGFDLGEGLSATLEGWGVDAGQARQGYQQAGAARGLTAGRGDSVSQEGLVKGVFGDSASASANERAAKARANRFAGGGGYAGERSGATGIGSSSS
jgi:hypothetical protein